MKQKLLTDIELDVRELKILLDSFAKEPTEMSSELLKRNIMRMQERLGDLLSEIEAAPADAVPRPLADPQSVTADERVVEPEACKVEAAEEEAIFCPEQPKNMILGERLKQEAGLRQSISLNDSFRFSRELFGGDAALMNRVIEQISVMSSYQTAVAFLASTVHLDEENEAVNDFLGLLQKYFNS